MTRHDSLHMQDGLACCWCLCGHCWQPEGRTAGGQPKGRCICRDCPCRRRP